MVIVLGAGAFELTPRSRYLFVAHPGGLASAGEVQRYAAAVERAASSASLRRALIDVRRHTGHGRPEVDAAWWHWLETTAALDRVAVIASDPVLRARIDTRGVACRRAIRAHSDTVTAARWLADAAGAGRHP